MSPTPTSTITDERDILRMFFEGILPVGREGHLHTVLFRGGHFTESGRYEHTEKPELKSWHYPTELGDAIAWILEARHRGDVYFAPTLMLTGEKLGRRKDNIIGNWQAHVDGDKGLDYIEVEKLGGCVVLTGSPGHAHAHFPFAEEISAEQREVLAKKLREHFDGDDKIAANDLLRPPCTLNWKSGAPRFPATERTGAPTETRLVEPFSPTRVKPYALARDIGVDLANICTVNGSGPTAQPITGADKPIPGFTDPPKPIDMKAFSWIQEEVDYDTGDRSADISRIVKACHDTGLEPSEIRWVLNQRPDLVAKLGELHHDDVLRNWNKIADLWPHPQIRRKAIIDRIIADWQASAAAAAKAKWTFIDGATFILDIPAEIPALWGKGNEVLWAEGESLMIAAPLGLGKTTIGSLLLRAQLGLGDGSLLGYPVPVRGGKILYLAMDRPAQVARAMARQFGPANRQVLADRLVFWKGPPPSDVAKDATLLAQMADAAGADTIYLDSVKDAALGLSDDEVGAGYNRARQHLLGQGVQLCEQHHTVKRGPKGSAPVTVADIYGSAWITNGTGSIILLTGDPGDPIVGFLHLRAPADTVGPYKLIHDQHAGTMGIYHSTDLLALVATKGIYGLSAKDAACAIFDTAKPTSSHIEKARRRLDKLVGEGRLMRSDGTKGGGTGVVSPTVWFAT